MSYHCRLSETELYVLSSPLLQWISQPRKPSFATILRLFEALRSVAALPEEAAEPRAFDPV